MLHAESAWYCTVDSITCIRCGVVAGSAEMTRKRWGDSPITGSDGSDGEHDP